MAWRCDGEKKDWKDGGIMKVWWEKKDWRDRGIMRSLKAEACVLQHCLRSVNGSLIHGTIWRWKQFWNYSRDAASPTHWMGLRTSICGMTWMKRQPTMSNTSPWKAMMTWTNMMTFMLTTKCLDLHCTVHTIVFAYSISYSICTIKDYWWTSCFYCYRVKWI